MDCMIDVIGVCSWKTASSRIAVCCWVVDIWRHGHILVAASAVGHLQLAPGAHLSMLPMNLLMPGWTNSRPAQI